MSNESRNSVSLEEIKILIKKLQWLQEKMENKRINFIGADANTYLISEYISIAGKGFIDLDNLGSYVDEENENFEIY